MKEKKNTYKNILESFSRLGFIEKLEQKIKNSAQHISIKNLSGSLKAFAVAAFWKNYPRKLIIVCSGKEEAEQWHHDLGLIMEKEKLAILTEPIKQVLFRNDNSEEQRTWLIEGLSVLTKYSDSIAITIPEIFKFELPKSNLIDEHRTTLNKGQELDFEEFIKELALNGFDRMDYVSGQGEIAVRGGIVDIFPTGWNNPLRIEFWGDEISSIREFDILSQRSIYEHNKIEFISHVFYSTNSEFKGSFYEYIDEETILILDSPENIEIAMQEPLELDNYRKIIINNLGDTDILIKSEYQPGFQASVKNFCSELEKLSELKYQIVLCADGKIHLERFRDIISNNLEFEDESGFKSSNIVDSIIWLDETVTSGFILPEYKIACFAEHQVFDRIGTQTKRGTKSKGGITLKELKQLKIGDFIVHEDKGIGIFDGFEKIMLGGSLQDCVRILYQDGDMLYVHLNYLFKVQQYQAQEGVVPKVNKLGSADWLRKKAKTKKRLKDIARELIKLYAQRKMQPGYVYPIDTIWQKEFEASFIYEDTPDQATSTQEVKKDMESPSPMDRLICGDVGYGKTEIAIRAAFKAAQTGRQVAVLVPTTILAQQHYMTFKDRLARYPVITEVLSRFRTKTEQKEVIENLKKGGVDILIGTHRILSKDIDFKDLGLLVIDEEQRFGVAAKEKLRQMRVTVDTLTLTATPIPRTLNFSLMGARDLSIIETPPRNRIPIHTEIMEWNQEVICEAINHEIERGGQVFIVNDKIEGLDKIAMDLQMLMPKLKIAVGHGQMNSSDLEKVMEKFIERKFDVLVSTKIIESGLDIPNANTMIIYEAHRFGLAELYQLRGRVGRTNVQAYCYLLIPPVHKISTRALQRLRAIEEFTELGSGFQLAMRDLEIRGAGDLLGPDQSGFINDIGFELYHKILDEAVQELRIEEFSDIFDDSQFIKDKRFANEDVAIELDTDALLPANYIKSDSERFTYYKQLYKIKTNDELKKIIDELEDRYGKLPKEALELIFVVKLRMASLNTGFTRINIKGLRLSAEFPPETNIEYYEKAFPVVADFLNDIPKAKLNHQGKKLFLIINLTSRDQAVELIWRIKKTLEMVD